RRGGRTARDAAAAYWTTPGRDTMRRYLKVCFPLYSCRGARDRNLVRRAMLNTELAYAFAAGEQRTFNLLPRLSRLRCPTLVLAGEEDPITPIVFAEELAAAIPHHLLRFERFANAGHDISRDEPERFFKTIREFIAGEHAS